ncbi:MAG: PIN domain-containing protein [Bryobacteraceae bacterium]|jgi:predicted nucleic acid-binding protein
MKTAGRSLLDTNILVYSFLDGDKAKQTRARALVRAALDKHDAIISFQVVQEFLNVATRRPQCRMSQAQAQLYLSKVLAPLCEVLPDTALYSNALSIADETGWSFYDSVVVSSALAGGCDTVLTEDLQDGRTIRGIVIRNPF